MRSRFDLIIFDWDGTLMDSAGRIVDSVRATAVDLALVELTEVEMRNVIGLGLREAIMALYPDLDVVAYNRFVERYRYHYLEACPTPAPLFEGVIPLLEELRTHNRLLAVATGKSRAGLNRVLTETGSHHYFQVTRCADETCSKPDPQMLREIIEDLGVAPDNTLMVGDTEYDLDMARRAGVASLAVSYGAHEPLRLKQFGALGCVDSIAHMRQWLLSNLN
ncbi:MAG: HAD-IA family hydrolase [Gammaproteobacteria bacterium]|nr:HAD-IA family hydrolase [Gammaproteobacteria bacterium]